MSKKLKKQLLTLMSLSLALPVAEPLIKYSYVEEELVYAQSGNVIDSKDKTQEEINAEEGISAEQIVVQISDDGYVTSHGDHYHYYNGKVPFNSIICENMLAPEDYELNEADVINEVSDGHIVKVDGEYYLVLDPAKDEYPNLRTVDELVLQSKNIHPEDAKAIVDLKEKLELPEGSKITYEEEKTPEEVEKEADVKSEFVAAYLTEDCYAAVYGINIYVFPGQVPEDMLILETALAPDDYVFNEEDVIGEVQDGKVVLVRDFQSEKLNER